VTFNESLFWSKVDQTDTCWLWQGYINREGYGEYVSKSLTTRLAHRIAYGLDKGGLPKLPLDHLCRHRHCVNQQDGVPTRASLRRRKHVDLRRQTLL